MNWIEYAVSAALMAGLLWCNRYNYRLGVHDGWRAFKHPRDPLWNKARAALRSYGVEADDAE